MHRTIYIVQHNIMLCIRTVYMYMYIVHTKYLTQTTCPYIHKLHVCTYVHVHVQFYFLFFLKNKMQIFVLQRVRTSTQSKKTSKPKPIHYNITYTNLLAMIHKSGQIYREDYAKLKSKTKKHSISNMKRSTYTKVCTYS